MKGLHSSASSVLVPTVISTASNFIAAAILGVAFFKEPTNFLWWIGSLMIVSGLYFIVSENEKSDKKVQ